MTCVLKPWALNLTLQVQGSLLCAVRGPDGVHKEDTCKPLVRAFRAVLLYNAKPLGPNNPFAGNGTGITSNAERDAFIAGIDKYNIHWLSKFMLSSEIVGYCHPNPNIANFWQEVYCLICEHLHVEMERKDRMLARLSGDGE